MSQGAAAPEPGPASCSASAYTVEPLSVQPDGNAYLVGSVALGAFYQFPPQGVAILRRLQEGASLQALKARSADQADDDPVDVDDFVATLLEIGFIKPADAPPAPRATPAVDKRWLFDLEPRVASAFFSAPALAGYGALLCAAIVCAVGEPAARPQLDAFYLDQHLAATLILLLVLSTFTTALHELGHLLAAARVGVASRVGIGTRLWNVVIEADLSGIFALPKRRRYLPLAAGMFVDLLTIATTTLAITWLARNDGSTFLIAVLQALVLQTLVTITWQFNIFLRTDVYYLLSTWTSYPTLDADARAYLASRLHAISLGRLGRPATVNIERLRALQAFSTIWVAGRLLSIAILILVVLPTLARYCIKAWTAYRDPASSFATMADAGIFAAVSILLLIAGLTLWLAPKFMRLANR